MKNTLFNITLKVCEWLEVKFLDGHNRREWSTEMGHVGHFAGEGKLTYCYDTEGDGVEGISIGRLHWSRDYQLSNYGNPMFLWVDKSFGRWRISRYLKYLVYRRLVDSRIKAVRKYCYDYVITKIPVWDRDYIFNKLYRSIKAEGE